MEIVLRFLADGLTGASAFSILIYTLVATHVTIVAVTVYLHRHQAHRALSLHPVVTHFFRFWLWLTTGMVTREWVAIHRKHHAHCERPGDPHSPRQAGLSTVLLRGAELYRTASRDHEAISRYATGCPDDWIERRLYSRFTWQGVGLLLIVDVALFGIIGLTVWGVQMLWIPVLAAGVINGAGHAIGYRNFDCQEAATNIVPLGLLIGGEELHNNHHTFATSAKLSVKWYEFDIGWMYIRLMQWLGLARARPLPAAPDIRYRHAQVDTATLRAVLGNRARVMAALNARLKPVWRRELRSLALDKGVDRRAALRLLSRDPGYLDGEEQGRLGGLLASSDYLRRVQGLREQLAQLWQRSLASEEQLLEALSAWCARAAEDKCARVRAFATELRGYA
ncbi:fatty acid desaturase [Massilia sp. IC2-477]|uniref:DesA family fatty acid desaturase n=1 Tax=Massilia sp. IC2-477 TaxID=2887198 RepID=UPI001D11187F|nr:fatty acid desaturase [Massilia sp. IC2-477]MCC2954690.1 fatty acid desaturase [Massilia sp. IC2-477]